jgi:hypothetical protein
MIAVIKGDIISSRKLKNQEKWLKPLKTLLQKWGKTPQQWELAWGDFFQLEIPQAEKALKKAIEIKALIKKIEPIDAMRKNSTIDLRMAIGIGDKTYTAKRISESNGSAFINAGEKFDILKKENTNIGIKSPWEDFDEEINLYLKLAGLFMDTWSVSSAELVEIVINNKEITQKEIGAQLGIKQSAVSGRWKRTNVDEVLAVEKLYREKIRKLIL